MTELPQATSRRELRDREAAARVRPAGTLRGHVGRAVLSFSSMLFVSALAVGLSIPASAFSTPSSARADAATSGSATSRSATASATASSAAAASALDVEAQSATVSPDQTIAIPARDGYTSQSRADLLAAQYAVSGIRATGKGSVRWPFTGQAVISSSYGPRAPVCSGSDCTDDFHHGTDFLPGDGAPIFSIASGVVVDHSEGGVGSGQLRHDPPHDSGRDVVTSIYGHLQAGSSPLVVGQAVKVGDFVGLVGATGIATGPHLHLGITVNGVETDPLPWMIAHVK